MANPIPAALKAIIDAAVDNVSVNTTPLTDIQLKQCFEDVIESFKTVDPDKGRPSGIKY